MSFIKGEYSKPVHKRGSDSDEGGNDNIYFNEFILSSVNKTEQPETSFTFDYIEKAFKAFIDAILECDVVMNASENKDSFELVVNKLAGDKVNATMLSNIYEEIDQILEESKEDEDSEVLDLDYNDVEHILSASGVENVDSEKVKETFQTIFDDEQHSFKADSLLPKK